MKKYTYSELDAWINSLIDCVDTSGKAGIAIAHNYRVMKDSVIEFADKKKEAIIKYGEKTETGFSVTDPEKLEKFNKKMEEYGKMQVAVDIMKLTEEDLLDSGLTARQIIGLEFMLEPLPKRTKDGKGVKTDKPTDKDPIDNDRFGL